MVWFTAVRHARRALACLFGLLFSVGLMHGANYGAPQGGSDVRWLEEGKPIERELSVELAK